MHALLLTLLLFAPTGKEWSKAHGIGVRIPKTWKILKRDDGARAFVVEGPLLGDGHPRLVIWNMGGAKQRTLRETVDKFDDAIRKRAGWTRVARTDHKVGPWPAMRLAYNFQESGKAKGRARVSVILFGGQVYVLEMSGSARGFPSATFDQIEKSLEGKWTEVKLPLGAQAKVPPGWQVRVEDGGFRAAGPREALVVIQRDDGTPPESTESKEKIRFLGEKRTVRTATREMRGEAVTLRWMHHDGWSGVIIMPAKAWKEIGPGARAILASLELPSPRDGKND